MNTFIVGSNITNVIFLFEAMVYDLREIKRLREIKHCMFKAILSKMFFLFLSVRSMI